jgi:hypothetical protein
MAGKAHSFSPESSQSSSSFPSLPGPSNLHSNQNSVEDVEKDDEHDERSTLRLSALEFMISLSEAGPNMVRKVSRWTDIIVRACLEGMGGRQRLRLQRGMTMRRRLRPGYQVCNIFFIYSYFC